jgi:hypothetical protein
MPSLSFESVRQFFRLMQEQGYRIEIRSFDQIMGTRGLDAVGFTIRGMCTKENGDHEQRQPLLIEDQENGPRKIGRPPG